MPGADWHWEQGNKFAVEGIKTLTILNGAAAIALMTFGTALKSFTTSMVASLILFALGAGLSVFVFVIAYMTQLEYGNAELMTERAYGERGSVGTSSHCSSWE